MATVAPTSLKWLANQWQRSYGSAVISGIVGDLAHRRQGGYHISRQDQPGSNYSCVRADDKAGPPNCAAAIDMSMNARDMKLCTQRLVALYSSRDPRRKYLNAFNGWLGSGDAVRWDIVASTKSWATPDHKWHVHLEIRRRYANDMTAARAIAAVLAGDKLVGAVSKPAPPKPAASRPKPKDGDEVSWTDDVIPVKGDPKNPTWAAKNALGYVVDLNRGMSPKVASIHVNAAKAVQELAQIKATQAAILKTVTGDATSADVIRREFDEFRRELLDELAPALAAQIREHVADIDDDALEDAMAEAVRNVLGSLDEQQQA